MKKLTSLLLTLIAPLSLLAAPMVNMGPADRFITLEAHALLGMRTITQNFRAAMPTLTNLDVNPNFALGAGVEARMAFNNFIGLGVALNLTGSRYKIDLVAVDQQQAAMTAAFVTNTSMEATIPIFISFGFNPDERVRWLVDCGLYYSYGITGQSSGNLYGGRINSLGQFIPVIESSSTSYFNNAEAFPVSSLRGDVGLHLATSLMFNRRFNLGLQFHAGLKNRVSDFNFVRRPRMNTIGLAVVIGYVI